jgi:hypothetical protein
LQALHSKIINNLGKDLVERCVELGSVPCEQGVESSESLLGKIIEMRPKLSLLVGDV